MPAVPPFATWSLKTKIALCSGGLMLAFSLAFATLTLGDFEADARRAVTASQLALARAAAAEIDARVDERSRALGRVAAVLATGRVGTGRDGEALSAAFPLFAELFDSVARVDAGGRVVFDTAPALAGEAAAPAERGVVEQALAGAAMSISSPIAGTGTGTGGGVGEATLVFATPLRASGGRIDGALLGRLRIDRPDFAGRPGRQRIGRSGFFTVVENSAQPVFVVHGHKERTLQPATEARTDPRLAPAFAGEEGSVERTNSLGVKTLSSFVPLRTVPWVLFTVYPTAEAFAQLRQRREAVIGVGAALCLLATALGWLMSSWLLRPLSELRALIDRQDDDPDLAMSPRDAGSSELAAVVAAYNAQRARRRDTEERLAASERRMAAVTNNIPAFIAHFGNDGRCTFVNRHGRATFGSDGAAPGPGRTLREILGDDSLAAEVAARAAAVSRGEAAQFETADAVRGRARRHQWSLVPDVATFGHVRGFYAMAFDITSLDEARARQAKVEQQLRAITDNLPVLISYIDRDERYVFLNATFQTWLGIDPARAVGRALPDFVEPSQRPRIRAKLQRCLRGERLDFESDIETPEGRRTLHAVFVPDLGEDGAVAGLYALGTDVTALRDAERQLSRLVRSDALTGLANRYQFNEVLPRALARSARSRKALALMFLDIDHFKRINDTLGHAGGDAALKEIARRLQGSVRATDLVARLAGDEFVVILEGLRSEAEPEHVARKVLAAVQQPFDIEGRRIDVTVSVGIAYRENADVSAPEILARADSALYAAKDAGRNNYRMAVMA